MNQNAATNTKNPAPLTGLAELLRQLTTSLVDTPEAVQIEQRAPDAEGTTVFDVTVGQGELGQALGKEGRLANAMRLIVKSAARKHNLGRILIEFKDQATKLGQDTAP